MNEKVIYFGEFKSHFGVYTVPEYVNSNNKTAFLIFNAGNIYRIGPNRMYVNLARKLAEKGIASFRFDLPGIGDSSSLNKNEDFIVTAREYVKDIMREIKDNESIINFILLGFCTTARVVFELAQSLDDVAKVILINGIYASKTELQESPPTAHITAMRYYKKHIFSIRRWWKFLRGKSHGASFLKIFKLLVSVLTLPFKKTKGTQKKREQKNTRRNISLVKWRNLLNKGIDLLLIFSEGSNSLDLYNVTIADSIKSNLNNDQIRLEIINNVDHSFTPVWSQNFIIKYLIDWIKQY